MSFQIFCAGAGTSSQIGVGGCLAHAKPREVTRGGARRGHSSLARRSLWGGMAQTTTQNGNLRTDLRNKIACWFKNVVSDFLCERRKLLTDRNGGVPGPCQTPGSNARWCAERTWPPCSNSGGNGSNAHAKRKSDNGFEK